MSENNEVITISVGQEMTVFEQYAFQMTKYEMWHRYPETMGMNAEAIIDWINANEHRIAGDLSDRTYDAVAQNALLQQTDHMNDAEIMNITADADLSDFASSMEGRGMDRVDQIKTEGNGIIDAEMLSASAKNLKYDPHGYDDDAPEGPQCIADCGAYDKGMIAFHMYATKAGLDVDEFKQFYLAGVEFLRDDMTWDDLVEEGYDSDEFKEALSKKSLKEILDMNRKFIAAANAEEVAHV